MLATSQDISASLNRGSAPRCVATDRLTRTHATLGVSLMLIAPGIVPLLAEPRLVGPYGQIADELSSWGRTDQAKSVLAVYRDLIRLRGNVDGNTRGLRGEHVLTYHVNQPGLVVAMHQWDKGGAGDSVIIVANLAAIGRTCYRVGLPAPGPWCVRFSSDWVGDDPVFGTVAGEEVYAEPIAADEMRYSATLDLPAIALRILSQPVPVQAVGSRG